METVREQYGRERTDGCGFPLFFLDDGSRLGRHIDSAKLVRILFRQYQINSSLRMRLARANVAAIPDLISTSLPPRFVMMVDETNQIPGLENPICRFGIKTTTYDHPTMFQNRLVVEAA